jgi:Tfp pilus assembly protein PilE
MKNFCISATDTSHFLRNVCQIRTPAKKVSTDLGQSGRSMIEMLGVLAVIGVLSVGGIAGYSKAMMKFKINKTVDLVAQMAANTRTLFSSQGTYEGLNENIVKKAKLAPEEIFNGGYHSKAYFEITERSGGNSGTNMSNPFGGGVYIGYAFRKSSGTNEYKKGFAIGISGVPEDACIELATLDWGSTSSGLTSVAVNAWSGYYMDYCPSSGNIVCSGEVMQVATAATYCSGNDNRLLWTFH